MSASRGWKSKKHHFPSLGWKKNHFPSQGWKIQSQRVGLCLLPVAAEAERRSKLKELLLHDAWKEGGKSEKNENETCKKTLLLLVPPLFARSYGILPGSHFMARILPYRKAFLVHYRSGSLKNWSFLQREVIRITFPPREGIRITFPPRERKWEQNMHENFAFACASSLRSLLWFIAWLWLYG